MQTKKQIYTKDKNVKITFRCDTLLSDWVMERSQVIGLTPSAFVRQMLYQQFYAEKTIFEKIPENMIASTETAAHHADN